MHDFLGKPDWDDLRAMKPDSPYRWETCQVWEAAQKMGLSEPTIRNWIKRGWVREGEHYNKVDHGIYDFDMYHLTNLAVRKESERGLYAAGEPYRKPQLREPYARVEELKRNGWAKDQWEYLSYREAAHLCGVHHSMIADLVNRTMEFDSSSILHDHPKKKFHLDSLVVIVNNFKTDKPRPKRKNRKQKKEEFDALVRDFMGYDYIEPSVREGIMARAAADPEHLRIEAASARNISRGMGSKAARTMPYRKPNT